MSADILLARLEDVRNRGASQWLARCPAHEDRTPSLSVRETDDGTCLVHCFAACSPADVLAAVGLELRDLFPERPTDSRRRRQRPRFSARDVLEVLGEEAQIVLIIAHDVRRGVAVPDADFDRLVAATNRIARLREILE